MTLSITEPTPAGRGRPASAWFRQRRDPSPTGFLAKELESVKARFNDDGYRNQSLEPVSGPREADDANVLSHLNEAFFKRLRNLAQELHNDIETTIIVILEVGKGPRPDYYKIFMEGYAEPIGNSEGEEITIAESEGHGETEVDAFKSIMKVLEVAVKRWSTLSDADFEKKFPANDSGMEKFLYPKSPYPRLSESQKPSPVTGISESGGSLEAELAKLQETSHATEGSKVQIAKDRIGNTDTVRFDSELKIIGSSDYSPCQ